MKILAKTGVTALAAGLIFGFGTVTMSSDAGAAWKPRKPVEFVIMAGKGGGADKAGELDAQRALDQGARLAAVV